MAKAKSETSVASLASAQKENQVGKAKIAELEKSMETSTTQYKKKLHDVRALNKDLQKKFELKERQLEMTKADLLEVRRDLLETRERLREIENTKIKPIPSKSIGISPLRFERAKAFLVETVHAATICYNKVEPFVRPVVTAIAKGCNNCYKWTRPRVIELWSKTKPFLIRAADRSRKAVSDGWESTSDTRSLIRQKVAPVVDPVTETASKLMSDLSVRLEKPMRVCADVQKSLVASVRSGSDVAIDYLELLQKDQREKQRGSKSLISSMYDYLITWLEYVYSNSEDFVLYVEGTIITLFVYFLYKFAVGKSKGKRTKTVGGGGRVGAALNDAIVKKMNNALSNNGTKNTSNRRKNNGGGGSGQPL